LRFDPVAAHFGGPDVDDDRFDADCNRRAVAIINIAARGFGDIQLEPVAVLELLKDEARRPEDAPLAALTHERERVTLLDGTEQCGLVTNVVLRRRGIALFGDRAQDGYNCRNRRFPRNVRVALDKIIL